MYIAMNYEMGAQKIAGLTVLTSYVPTISICMRRSESRFTGDLFPVTAGAWLTVLYLGGRLLSVPEDSNWPKRVCVGTGGPHRCAVCMAARL